MAENFSEEELKKSVTKYEKDYSENGFWDKVKNNAKSAGLTLIYKALQLFYVAQSPDCPTKIKAGIIAALGYFISPIDLIPDFTPILGYTDDIAAIGMALILAEAYITDDIKSQAKAKISSIFGEKAVAELDA